MDMASLRAAIIVIRLEIDSGHGIFDRAWCTIAFACIGRFYLQHKFIERCKHRFLRLAKTILQIIIGVENQSRESSGSARHTCRD